MLKYLFIVGSLLFVSNSLSAQRDSIYGVWEGILTVEKDNEIISEYEIFFRFTKTSDGNIFGISTINYKNLSANISLESFFIDENTLVIEEKQILKSDELPNGEWCLKRIVLHSKLENNRIFWEGKWSGKTSFSTCTPGKIKIVRGVERV